MINHNRVGKLRKGSTPLCIELATADGAWTKGMIILLFLWFCRSFFMFILYLLTLSVLHIFTALSWSHSLTHNAVNSSNSLRYAGCTMLHDASCQFGMDDVRCQYRIFRMNTGRCMVSWTSCKMQDVYFAHRAEIGRCAMHDVVCTMYDVQSEINFVTQLVISIVRTAHAERNPRHFCWVLDRCA